MKRMFGSHAMRRGFLVMLLVVGVLCVGQMAFAQSSKITVWSFGSFTDWLKSLATTFESQNPGSQVVIEGYPYGQMHDNLLIAVQTGTGAPNLATIEISQVAKFYKGQKVGFLDLTPTLKRSGRLDQIYASRLAPFTFKGTVYGVPFDLSSAAFLYRVDAFASAGIDINSLQTWNDFLKAAQKLKSQGKFALQLGNGTGADAEWGHFWMWLIQAGGGIFDSTGKVILDNSVAVSVLDFYRDAVKKYGIANTSSYGVSAPAWWAPYRAAQVVADFGPDWYMGFMKANAPEMSGKWRIAPMPAWKAGAYRASTWGGTMLSIVPSSDADADAVASKFLEYVLMNKDNVVTLYTQTGMLPPFKDLTDAAVFAKPDPYFGGQPMGKILLQLGPQVPPFYLAPTWPEASEILGRKVILEALTTTKSSLTILHEAAEEVRNIK